MQEEDQDLVQEEEGDWEDVSNISDVDERIDNNNMIEEAKLRSPSQLQELKKEGLNFLRNKQVKINYPTLVDLNRIR